MTKEVLVSPGHGAGWASWATKGAKQLAEDEELIRMVRNGEHIGSTTARELIQSGCLDPEGCDMDEKWAASLAFCKRAFEVAGKLPYCGGVKSLIIEEVDGPYRIAEYDGYETIETPGGTDWW